MSLDRDTAETLGKDQDIFDFVKSRGWAHVRRSLLEKIADLGDIRTITQKDADLLMAEVGSRQMSTDILIDWLGEVEGVKDRTKYNEIVKKELKQEAYILNIEEPLDLGRAREN